MTIRGAGRKREMGQWGDSEGTVRGLTTASHNGAKTSSSSVVIYSRQTSVDKSRQMHDMFHCPLTDSWSYCGSWPRPRLPCWPLPYPTSDPMLRTICNGAPCSRPHHLIKCDYHQPLLLSRRGGESGGDKLLEGNKQICCTHFFLMLHAPEKSAVILWWKWKSSL